MRRHVLSLLVVGLTACGNPVDVIDPVASSTTLLADTTASLAGAADDLSRLTYRGDERALAALLPGKILASGPTDKLPKGMLRRIESVTRAEGTATVATTQATIEEAVENGSASLTGVPLELAPAGLAPVERGVSVALEGKRVIVTFTDVQLYDADGSDQTVLDRVIANGVVSFEPTLDLAMRVAHFRVQQLELVLSGDQSADVTISAAGGSAFLVELPLVELPFSPVVFQLGLLPVVITPQLRLFVGADGVVSTEISTSLMADAQWTGGALYAAGDWQPVYDGSFAGSVALPTLSAAEADVKSWLRARIELLFYGVAGAHGEASTALRTVVQPAADPWWEAYGGLRVGAGVKLDAVVFKAQHEWSLIDIERKLADAGGPL